VDDDGREGDLRDDEERAMWEPMDEPSRMNYFPGRVLTADDLAAEQAQTRARLWLHNRVLHGVGIATGLEVTAERNTLLVAPGVAIDALGREIVLTEQRSLDASSVVHESHGRLQVVIAWAEEPADTVVGPDGLVPGRFVERPHLLLAEHTLGEAPEHAVPLARVYRRGDELVADPSIRLHVHQPLHRDLHSDVRRKG
jgi:hypothetical protein